MSDSEILSPNTGKNRLKDTLLFDPDWYCQEYRDVGLVGMDPADHYARYGAVLRRNPGPLFDARGYAASHALANDTDALAHFLDHYATPCPVTDDFPVKDLERKLWGGFSEPALNHLEAAIGSSRYSKRDRTRAAFVLARWYSLQGLWDKALRRLLRISDFDRGFFRSKKCKLLIIECLVHLGEFEKARAMIDFVLDQRMDGDFACARCNLALAEGAGQHERFETINAIFTASGLSPVALADPARGVVFGNWRDAAPGDRAVDGPLVSILVPVYKASDFIETSIGSLLAQTWRNLEIVAVDDCSPDDSWEKLQALAARDTRLKVFRNDVNVGAYSNRNNALARATGDFVTVHDSDDWSHPQMIELQMRALMARPSLKATWSRMVRVHPDLRFILRPQRENLEYVHRSYPSLLMRRADLAKLGEWDGVSANADDELLQRVRTLWGQDAIEDVLPDVPMSFFLVHENSLTQQKGTSLNSLTFGIRKEYARQATYWRQTRGQAKGGKLALTRRSMKDPFPIPAGLAPKNWAKNTAYDIVLVSDLSLLGGTRRCNEGYIAAARAEGLRVGLFHWPRFDLKFAEVAKEYLELSYDPGVDILVPEDKITAKLVIVHHPPILGTRIDGVPTISADRLAVLVNQSPMQCWSQKPFYYDGEEAGALCRELFGLDPVWIPISPRVRAILQRVGGFGRIHDDIWYPPFHGTLPDDTPPLPEGLGKARPIRIGRHARDHWTKWPSAPETLGAAYCADAEGISVNLLGGARTALKSLGTRPENWNVAEFDSVAVNQFLQDLDVFVHYVHEDYIEEFGRNAMEAMAAGRVAILSPDFKSTFGDGAVYALPQDVAKTARALFADPEAYRAQVDRGLRFVRRASSQEAVQAKLRKLLV